MHDVDAAVSLEVAALVVEILAATLTGAKHSSEASSFFDAEGEPPGVGQLIMAFDTSRVAGEGFTLRLEALLAAVLGQEGTRLPGEKRIAGRRAVREGEGVLVPGHLLEEIEALAGV